LVGEWQVCRTCRVVDRDQIRTRVGSICPECGEESKGGLRYFVMSAETIVDLMREASSTQPITHNEGTELEYQINTHNISVLLFFCTLREVLMQGFIREMCMALGIPENIYERLNLDNKLHSQKQDKLFPSLTGSKWNNAISELDRETSKNYTELNDQVVDLVKHRNKFIHKAQNIFNIDDSVANRCIQNVEPLIHLYVDLHNKYVHKIYIERNRS